MDLITKDLLFCHWRVGTYRKVAPAMSIAMHLYIDRIVDSEVEGLMTCNVILTYNDKDNANGDGTF